MIHLLLLACRQAPTDDASRFLAAANASTWAQARDACVPMQETGARSDCLLLVIGRFHEFSLCDTLLEGTPRRECHFRHAETLVHRGRPEDALAACVTSGFDTECNDHVMSVVGGRAADEDPASVAARWEDLASRATGRAAERQLWRSYWRERIQRGEFILVDGCPNSACRKAAEMEVGARGEERARLDCTAPMSPDWAADDTTLAWVHAAFIRACRPPPMPPGGMERPPFPR